MKVLNLVLFLVLLAVIGSIVTLFFYEMYSIESYKVLPVKIKVDNKVGIAVDKEVLNFGIVPPGAVGSRNLILNSDHPVKVVAVVSNNLLDLLSIGDNGFILNGEKNLGITVSVPYDTEKGEYTGYLKVFYIRI